jgi:hypothetical protein
MEREGVSDGRTPARSAHRWKKVGRVALLVGGLVVVCAGACLVAGVLAGRRPGAPSAPGLTVHVCAGLVTDPRWRVGVGWYSPLSSYRGPLASSPYALCADVPWPFRTRQLSGEWLIPR